VRHDIEGGYVAGFRTVLVNRRQSVDSPLADYQFTTLRDALPTLESL
jgi:FMN phosphatase YigB (HAD superfamily)